MSKQISKRKEWLFRSILVIGSIAITLIVLNKLFYSGSGGSKTLESISYNDSINLANKAFSDKNPYGFTDVVHTKEKPVDVKFRIAVLGDSFIWGDGLPYEQVWSHKLERRIKEKYNGVEVLHWGCNGWQTKQHLAFYDTAGTDYNVDLLILGYVDNDPDMGYFKHMHYNYKENYRFLYAIAPSMVGTILDRMYSRSYAKWQKRLYEEENLGRYRTLLSQLKARFDRDSLTYFVVMTPACLDGRGCHQYYEVVKPTLGSVGFNYIDVFDTCLARLGHLPHDSIRANPVNNHPGKLMTNIFAEQTFNYITANKMIPDSLLAP